MATPPHTTMMGVASSSAAAPSASTFKVLTYNIWFDREHMIARTATIVQLLQTCDADFVCLQECTHQSHTLIAQSAALAAQYDVSPPPDFAQQPGYYYTLILARKSLGAAFWRARVPTFMERDLLFADVSMTSTSDGATPIRVRVCTSHFESLNSRDLRAQQLARAAEHLKLGGGSGGDGAVDFAVLCGDFNFCSDRDFRQPVPTTDAEAALLENVILRKTLPHLSDMWPALTADAGDRGYTFDSQRNDVIRAHERMRYDRILAGGAHFVGTQIALVGTEPCADLFYDDRVVRVPARPSKSRADGDDQHSAVVATAADAKVARTSQTATVSSGDNNDAAADAADGCGTPPPRPPRRVFPSDHFGVLCTFEVAK